MRREESARSDQRRALRDLRLVPERAVLRVQQYQLAVRRGPRGAPRFVEQHQRQEPRRLGLGQQLDQEPSQPDRLAREIVPRQRGAGGREVSLVEHQVDHVEHRVEPVRQVGSRRHLIGDPRVPDLRLGAHDSLGHRRRGAEEGVRDLLGREAAHLAQRQRHLGGRRQGGVAAGEDQPQAVVFDVLALPLRGLVRVGVEPLGEIPQRRVEPGAPAQAVDGLEAAGRDEPRAGVGRCAVPRPLLDRGCEGLVERLLGQVEVAEEADEGGEHAARVGTVDGLHPVPYPFGRVLAHQQRLPATTTRTPGSAVSRCSLGAPTGSSRPPGWPRSGPGP